MTSIASTEHGLPRGWIHKKILCDEAGIKFLHGVEMYITRSLDEKVRDNYHTILIAKNMDGIRELNKIVSMSAQPDHSYYTNRISCEEFLRISNNVIKISACLASPLRNISDEDPIYESLVRHYDYLEVQPHNHPDQIEFNKKLYGLSQKYGVPLIAGTDTHSVDSYHAECRDILLLAKGKKYADDTFDLTAKTYYELVDMFRIQDALPEEAFMSAIENTNVMSDSCDDWSLDTKIKYPILYGSQENDEKAYEELVWTRLDEKLRSGVIPREQETAFREAIKEELRVFNKIHMSGFMLCQSELITWCKQQNMAIGTARGSVGGSRCAYVSDIIDLNPEQWHTVFSRFANENREEIGDIDIDCVESDRPKIFEYIVNRFGKQKTARVASYNTNAEKGIIDDVGRALSKKVVSGDDDWNRGLKKKRTYSLAEVKEIKKLYNSEPEKAKAKYPELFYYMDGLLGVKMAQSIHPAGMVISPITLDDNFGVFLGKDGDQCLMLDMDEVHDGCGLAKYDFLVLTTVQIIRDACNYAGIQYPKTHEIDFNDENVWKDMMRSPVGIFQFEAPYAFDSLKKFHTSSIFDMSLVTAAIRPSGASYREKLLAREVHHNPSSVIDELLKDNLGYLVYQCDIIAFLQNICGLSGSQADNVRRGIARKKIEILEKAMPSILNGYCEKSGKERSVAEEEAKEFLKIIEDASSYMFGYNHSVAYCILGYYCAYMRYYHPIEFLTSYLNNAGNDDDIQNGTSIAHLYGIKITSPKFGISKSGYFFDRETQEISKGLGSIKYISVGVANKLYELGQNGKYQSFVDLLHDMYSYAKLDARQLNLLVKLDFFSDFGNQRELVRIIDIDNQLKNGEAKSIKKDIVAESPFDEIIKRHSIGVTKSGKDSASYTKLDCIEILHEAEAYIKSVCMDDLPEIIKIINYQEITGTFGYMTGKEEDRPKLFVKALYPVVRKKDGKQFGYSVLTQSIGSGKESRFTVFNRDYDKDPIHENDLILCIHYTRDGQYFQLDSYEHIIC